MSKALQFCFQKTENNVHKLYIYDDVKAYGSFNWSTWERDESETSAKYFRDQLDAIPDTDQIELHINSNGGSVKEGVAIYNLLKQKACKITGFVDGVAHSIAFVILQACDHRVMGIGTSALVHDMWIEVSGNAKELRKMADDLDVLMESNRKIFLERSNLTEEQLIDMMEKETFLTPDQSLEYGLIDEIGTYRAEENDVQEKLQLQIQQLKEHITQQKSFHDELLKLNNDEKPPQQCDLASKLGDFFKKM